MNEVLPKILHSGAFQICLELKIFFNHGEVLNGGKLVGDRGLANGSRPRASLELKPPLDIGPKETFVQLEISSPTRLFLVANDIPGMLKNNI